MQVTLTAQTTKCTIKSHYALQCGSMFTVAMNMRIWIVHSIWREDLQCRLNPTANG